MVIQISHNHLLTQKQWRTLPKTKILKWKKFHHSIHHPTIMEILMWPWVKQWKLHTCITKQKKALESFLQNYRDTPHPATGVSSAAMIFRDDRPTHFPRKQITEEECIKARNRDNGLKQQRTEKINCSNSPNIKKRMILEEIKFSLETIQNKESLIQSLFQNCMKQHKDNVNQSINQNHIFRIANLQWFYVYIYIYIYIDR